MSEAVEIFTAANRPLPPAAVHSLLQQTDWANHRTEIDVAALLAATSLCLGAWQQNRLIGFARALTDHRYRAFIEDVVVDAAFRGQGIGRALVTRLMQELAGIEEVGLLCVPALMPFYATFGFEQFNSPVAMRRPPPHQEPAL